MKTQDILVTAMLYNDNLLLPPGGNVIASYEPFVLS